MELIQQAEGRGPDRGNGAFAELLEPVGVFFQKVKIDGRSEYDFTTLVVPNTWPLEEMKFTLLRRAQSLRNLPIGSTVAVTPESGDSTAVPTSIFLCERCVHLHQRSCVLGYPVDWLDDDGSMSVRPGVVRRLTSFLFGTEVEEPTRLRKWWVGRLRASLKSKPLGKTLGKMKISTIYM